VKSQGVTRTASFEATAEILERLLRRWLESVKEIYISLQIYGIEGAKVKRYPGGGPLNPGGGGPPNGMPGGAPGKPGGLKPGGGPDIPGGANGIGGTGAPTVKAYPVSS
jgi:hypothetical protein